MSTILPAYFKVVTTVEHPAIPLCDGNVHVSRSSPNPLNSGDAMAFAARMQQPLQTADLGVIVRDELQKSPLEGVDDPLDGSNLYQRCSDLVLARKGELFGSDLQSMYPNDWAKQVEVAKKIGWGIEIPLNDEIVVRLLDTAGKRKALLPAQHWPYSADCATLGDDPVAHVIFPLEAGRQGVYLQRNGYAQCHFYLVNSELPDCLKGKKSGVLRPVGLGGGGGISGVNADDNYVSSGRARAGSVGAKNFPSER